MKIVLPVVAVAATATTTGAGAGVAAAAADPDPHSRPGVPRRSDVLLTSREQHLVPPKGTGAGSGLYTTFEAGDAFFANRIDWVYSTNASFLREAFDVRNYTGISLAMNANLPDPSNASLPSASSSPFSTGVVDSNHRRSLPRESLGASTYNIGRCENVHGEKLTAPWMRAWATLPYYGCVNNPAYRQLALDFAASLVRAGSTAVQHDDPTTNLECTGWNGGDPTLSGCYCPYCMAGFTHFVQTALTPAQRAAFNITAAFNYRDYLLGNNATAAATAAVVGTGSTTGRGGNGHGSSDLVSGGAGGQDPEDAAAAADATDAATDPSEAQVLREAFVAFQTNSTLAYIDAVRAHVAAVSPDPDVPVPLSCNNGGSWMEEVYRRCDYGLGELALAEANPASLRQIYATGVPPGKLQVMTMPKAAVIREPQDVPVVRASIAYAYALGSNMLVPWDIYLPTPDAKRYFGDAAEYGDLFAFVRANGALLDTMDVGLASSIDQGAYHLVYTGADGDKGRWRLPDDAQPVPGQCDTVCNSPAAIGWQCLQRPTCKGFFYGADTPGSRVRCCMVDELDPIQGTAVVGRSYKLDRAKASSSPVGSTTGGLVRTSSLDVVAEVRGTSAPVSSSTAAASSPYAVHVVNWANATAAAAAATPAAAPTVNVSIANALLDPACTKCSACKWNVTLHSLSNVSSSLSPSATATPAATAVPVVVTCAANVTTVSLDVPAPWAILEVSLERTSPPAEAAAAVAVGVTRFAR